MSEAMSNAINSTDAKRWVGEIERLDDEIAEFRDEMKERRASIYEAAETAGLPLAALKFELWRRKEARKAAAKIEKAGSEKVELADMIRDALGDFSTSPLGVAAVEAADAPAPEKPKAKRGRPAKSKTPLVGEEGGSDALSSLTDGSLN